MFTGLIEEVGTIVGVSDLGGGRVFRIAAPTIAGALSLGESVAIDGACLTVTAADDDAFEVQAIATTLERTTFGGFQAGRRVNLERSLAFGARLGGHLVQGHVDGVGAVTSIDRRDELVLIDFSLPDEVVGVTVLRGSITLNGISLTVNEIPAAAICQVSIIPFTWGHTNLADLRVGDAVNVEGDLIGKYVRHLVSAPGGGADLRRAWGYE